MKQNRAAMNNLRKAQQEKILKGGVTKDLRIAIVVMPDGEWRAEGGTAPESERMAKALWGTPDGSVMLWADVQAFLPAKFAQSETLSTKDTPSASPPPDQTVFTADSAPAPTGVFVGPGDPLPVIDVPN